MCYGHLMLRKKGRKAYITTLSTQAFTHSKQGVEERQGKVYDITRTPV